MTAQKTPKKLSAQAGQTAGKPILLALTLVPLVAGVLLIAAWSLDIALLADLDSQLWVGVLFILVSFALSNLFQKRWGLFIGWCLIAISDILLLSILNFTVQVIAIAIGVVGVILVLIGFYRVYRQQKPPAS